VCFFSIITPAFFTILYSMEWGKTKANEWLTTFVLSFFQSVIVVQPIKVQIQLINVDTYYLAINDEQIVLNI